MKPDQKLNLICRMAGNIITSPAVNSVDEALKLANAIFDKAQAKIGNLRTKMNPPAEENRDDEFFTTEERRK